MAKYRFGFVSNSSSSSFVVSFPKNMKITSKNIKKYLFSDLDDNQEMQGWDVTVRDIAEALAKRMTEQKERALNNLPSSEQCGDETDGELVINTLANSLTGAPEFDWDTWSDVFDDKLERYSIEQKYASEQDKFIVNSVLPFIDQKKQSDFDLYFFEFCDSASQVETVMETCDIFKNADFYIKQSNH
jgi:hypothetical protein